MAYDSTIPSLSNLIGDDIPQMQENFQLLEDSQVVDEGSTADGDYKRTEDGWQICTGEIIFEVEDTGGSSNTTWNFPQSFNNPPLYIGCITDLDDYGNRTDRDNVLPIRYRDNNDVSVIFNLRRIDGVDFNGNYDLPAKVFAIGRWK